MKIPLCVIDVIEQAADEMANNTCNDYVLPNTPENREFITSMNDRMSDETELTISKDGKKIYTYDWMVLSYVAKLIKDSHNE